MRIFKGLFFIVLAILLIPSMCGIFLTISLFKILITIALIGWLVKAIVRMHFVGIAFSLLLLVMLYAAPLGIMALLSWKIILVAIFIGIGLSMIFGNHRYYNNYDSNFKQRFEERSK